MAFNQEELDIINYAKQNGKTRQETEQALIRYREAKTPAPTEQGYLSRVGTDISQAGKRVQQAIAGEGEFAGQTPVRRGVEATAEAFGAVPKVVGESMPESVRNAMKSVGELLKKGFDIPVEALSNTKLFQEASKYPEYTKTLEEVLGTVAPAGEIAGTIVGAGAVKPTVDIAKTVATKAMGKGVQVAKAGAEKVAPTVTKTGKKLYSSAYDLTADEARLVQNAKINLKFLEKERAKFSKGSKEYASLTKQIETNKMPITRAETALEKGIVGTEKQIGVKSGVEKMDIWKNTLEPALKKSKDVMTKDELFAKARARVASEVEPTRKITLQNALDSLESDYVNFQPTKLLEMNKIKTGLDTFTPSKIFKGQEVASELKTLKADMASAIREKTYGSLKDINARKAYIDYGNLKQLEKVGIKALTEAGTKGGFGGFWSTVYDMATVPVKTVGGKVLYRVGNKLEFIGDKGTKTLRQHLEKNGVKIKKPQ